MTLHAEHVAAPQVVIVDDDAAVRQALAFTIDLAGFRAVACGSVGEALALDLPAGQACLVIDERLPDGSGLRLLGELRQRGCALPAALITSHVRRSVRQAAAGARAPIFEKPLFGDDLVNWIRGALAR